MTREAFGVDIGGSGIKAARVDLTTGEFLAPRYRIATPKPATPQAVAGTVRELVEHFSWGGPVGITLPSVVTDQTAHSAANIDDSWVGVHVGALFEEALGGREVSVLNDADAAGIAECRFGDPRITDGPVIFLTLGTGIGSAFLLDGQLFPNTEIGHLQVGKKEAEHRASASAKERHEWSYPAWAKRLSRVLRSYEHLFHPRLFVIGGGVSKHAERWVPHLELDTPVVPASLKNSAGIVGAALAAAEGIKP